MFNFTVTPLTAQFDDPYYPVLVEGVVRGSEIVNEVVIFEHDRLNGKYKFGKLEPIINRWPHTAVNSLKQKIKRAALG